MTIFALILKHSARAVVLFLVYKIFILGATTGRWVVPEVLDALDKIITYTLWVYIIGDLWVDIDIFYLNKNKT